MILGCKSRVFWLPGRPTRKARSVRRRCSSRRRDISAVPFGGGLEERDVGARTPANGTSAALPPLDPWARSLLRRRSAGKLLGKCNIRHSRPGLVSARARYLAAQLRANASRAAAASSTRPCGAGGSTNARKAGGSARAAQTGLSPPSRLTRGSLRARRAAAARTHASSHEPFRKGQ